MQHMQLEKCFKTDEEVAERHVYQRELTEKQWL